MVERLNGIQEVGSSNLLPSTKSSDDGERLCGVTARLFLCVVHAKPLFVGRECASRWGIV